MKRTMLAAAAAVAAAQLLAGVAMATELLTFAPKVDYELSESEPRQVTTGDFDQDGHLDLAVALSGNSEDPVGVVSVLLGDGQGSFGDELGFSKGSAAWGLASGDFDGDGTPDLAVAEGGSWQAGVTSIWLGSGDGSFTRAASLPGGQFPIGVATGDFDRDGDADVATAHNVSGGLVVYAGDGAGGFAPGVTVPSSGSMATHLVPADLNGDGHLDLVMAHYSGISFFTNDGTGAFAYTGGQGYPNLVEGVAAGDVNGDGAIDLATAEIYTGMATVYLNDGAGGFTQSHRVQTGGFVRDVAIADMNVDGFGDVLVSNQDQSTVSVLVSRGDGTFAPVQSFATGLQPMAVTAGDWNEDGLPDIAAPYRNLGDAPYTSVLLQSGTLPPGHTAPQIVSQPPAGDVTAGSVYEYQVIATGSPAPTFALPDGPAGMTIDALSGLLSWTPDATQAGTHVVTVRAFNDAGAVEQSFPVTVVGVVEDVTPPSTPAGLTATAVTRDSITLAWDPATDDVGVAGYQLYEYVKIKRKTFVWVMAQDGLTETTATVTGLAPRTKHTYAVVAYDAAGNASAMSPSLAVTTKRR